MVTRTDTTPGDGSDTGAATTATSAASMADPSSPGGLLAAEQLGSTTRRLIAWIVDLALIVAPTAAVAVTQTESMPRTAAAAAAIDAPWVSITLGDTMYRWTGPGLWLTALAAVLSAVIVLALIPANVEGWTPGLRLVGLRILATSGTRARPAQHLVRTALGVVDLVPFVIPGLLGVTLATRSPLRQRLGDRVARTVVVDLRHPERPPDPDLRIPPRPRWWQQSPPPAPPEPVSAREAAERWAIDALDADLAPLFPSPIGPISPVPKAGTDPSGLERRPETTTGGDRPGTTAAVATEPVPDPVPEWSEEHQAWVVRDTGTGQLFAHDPDTDRWRPLS